jgi:hypothetical protein
MPDGWGRRNLTGEINGTGLAGVVLSRLRFYREYALAG